MKRSPLARKTPLSRGESTLKRTPLKQGGELKRAPFKPKPSMEDASRLCRGAMEQHRETVRRLGETLARKAVLRKVNPVRAEKRRERDFGPHGNIIVPRLPCAPCFPWWYKRSDGEIADAMAEVLAWPEAFAVVSEPMHFEHSRGAGGKAENIVPGCPSCHASQHSDGVETFAAAHPENDFPALAARLWRLSPAREMMEHGQTG